MKHLLFALLFTGIGCRGKLEYERGWYNACYYVAWKNNHQAELPCVSMLEFTKQHPEVDFINHPNLYDSLKLCGEGGWINTETWQIPKGWVLIAHEDSTFTLRRDTVKIQP